MKPFIVAMAVIIMGTAGLIFRSDLAQYTMTEENLQALTEECAAYAALAIEKNEEDIQIEYSQARKNAERLMSYAQNYMPCFEDGILEIPENGFGITDDKHSVWVRIIYTKNKNFFRLSFAPKFCSLSRESCYIWEDSLDN